MLAARFYRRQPRDDRRRHRHQRQDLGRPFHRARSGRALGHPAASLGTLGLVTPHGRRPGALTTPDPVALHRDLAALAASGIDHVGDRGVEPRPRPVPPRRGGGRRRRLHQPDARPSRLPWRHGALPRRQGASVHRAADAGRRARCSTPTAPNSRGSPRCAASAAIRSSPMARAPAPICGSVAARPQRRAARPRCSRFSAAARELSLPLAGEFQAMNALAALGLGDRHRRPSGDRRSRRSPRLTGVPGRMQFVAEHRDGGGDRRRLRPHARCARDRARRRCARMRRAGSSSLFGCGGDRDAGKRPLMGAVAAAARRPRLCHRRQSAQRGPGRDPPRDPRRRPERRRNRRPPRARSRPRSASSAPGDLLVIAGKGHETGQIVGTETLPFDDADDRARDRARRPRALRRTGRDGAVDRRRGGAPRPAGRARPTGQRAGCRSTAAACAPGDLVCRAARPQPRRP